MTRLALGHSHSCAVHEDGSGSCWGANWGGQLGEGTSGAASPVPVRVTVTEEIVEMAARNGSTCARLRSGRVVCWGDEKVHDGPREPRIRTLAEGAVQLASDCARGTSGQVQCGFSGREARGIPGVEAALHVASYVDGGRTIRGCAVTNASAVVCWEEPGSAPRTIAGVKDAVEVAVGMDFACARLKDGGVSCWGANELGQLGRPVVVRRGFPMARAPAWPAARVAGLSGVVELGASHMGACARDAKGAVSCWGSSANAGTSPPSTIPEPAPVPRRVQGLGAATHVALGSGHACAIAGGTVSCWGKNEAGQVGMGWSGSQPRPTVVPGIDDAVLVQADSDETCAATRSGTLKCWGRIDSAKAATAKPTNIAGFEGIRQLAEGICARDDKGRVRCTTRAGDSAPKGRMPPLVDLSTSVSFGCGVTADGAVWCWGRNDFGQQGNGSRAKADALLPPAANGMTDVVRVATGGFHTCVVRRSRELGCFGIVWPRSLENAESVHLAPVVMPGLRDVTMAAGSAEFFCAVAGDGRVWCWGANQWGVLGDGTLVSRTSPAPVSNLTGATKIVTGGFHACALRANGTVACWGRGRDGQLGDGFLSEIRSEPVEAQGVAHAVDVSSTSNHTCAVLEDGKVMCWGKADEGQVGTIVAGEILAPATVAFP